MAIYSNQPGAQLYGSGFVFDEKGKQGTVYARFSGLCLETQAWPDSVNQANFPDTVARPGLPYRHELIVRFGTFSGPVDDAPSAPMQL